MTTEFHGLKPWQEITRAIKSAGPRSAAIAFVGAEAPLMVPLREGDLLVVNASKSAVAAHATGPAALEAFLDAGVDVRTSARLHAKVIATSTTAIIGSANGSAHSQASSEAVVITDQKSIVRAVHRFVAEEAAYATPITNDLITELYEVWDSAARAPVPGNNGVSSELRLLPEPLGRVWFSPTDPGDITDSERAEIEQGVEQAVGFAIYAMQLPDSDGYRVGDVVVNHDDEYVHSPVVIYSDVHQIPGRDVECYQLVRRQNEHAIYLLNSFKRRVGREVFGQLHFDEHVVLRKAKLRDAVLGVWIGD